MLNHIFYWLSFIDIFQNFKYHNAFQINIWHNFLIITLFLSVFHQILLSLIRWCAVFLLHYLAFFKIFASTPIIDVFIAYFLLYFLLSSHPIPDQKCFDVFRSWNFSFVLVTTYALYKNNLSGMVAWEFFLIFLLIKLIRLNQKVHGFHSNVGCLGFFSCWLICLVWAKESITIYPCL